MSKIAVQGIEGSFHDQAARAYFDDPLSIIPCERFENVIDAVTSGRADGALMAIENSIAGTILSNYTLIRDSGLFVTGEVMVRIEHHLMACASVSMSDVKEIRSHPMALQQCGNYLEKLPHVRRVETWDSAASARDLAIEHSPSTAVIAPAQAARTHGLVILASGIESNKRNFTRFFVLSRAANAAGGTRASICLSIEHRVGALARILVTFARHGINLTKIQSTPIVGREWEYWMFMDLEFTDRDIFYSAMNDIEPATDTASILGIFEKGKTIE
jgi:prephenate dehydratase